MTLDDAKAAIDVGRELDDMSIDLMLIATHMISLVTVARDTVSNLRAVAKDGTQRGGKILSDWDDVDSFLSIAIEKARAVEVVGDRAESLGNVARLGRERQD
jgi:hypothetical protein